MEDLLIPYEYVDAIFRFRISVKGVVGFSIPYEDKWVSLYIIPKNTQIILRITVCPMVIILNISKIANNWYTLPILPIS